jgi:hypothetical protein
VNFIDFIWVKPNFSLAAFEDGRGQTLLKTKRNHFAAEKKKKGETKEK